jgi:hypothetical protein
MIFDEVAGFFAEDLPFECQLEPCLALTHTIKLGVPSKWSRADAMTKPKLNEGADS